MGVLVVFDYDWSLVNENSDTYIFKVLCPELLDEIHERLALQLSWTKVMDDLLGELALRKPDVTRNDIQSIIAAIPIQPRMIEALKTAVDQYGAEVKIISDANSVYIQSMLDHHQVGQYVSGIFTNPAQFEQDSHRLRVEPFHSPQQEPHGCMHCPSNMCKGSILDSIRGQSVYDRIVYVGDGDGDFCPATRLSNSDVVLARADDEDGKSYGLFKKLSANANMIQARVVPWRTGVDIYEQFVLAMSN